ncbi:riboflavin biosynthesis protein RibD [Pajaroellobacter abortibovis]|uniref:Riboflavin biosynthesis protein RibD n=2 Tax=Pajaroellobacter abortibovis TaxID=1882918 RepID=A0A1L6MXR5_9BACT|nr:riboflavin biosynthesis protein RibD [Pajaroellobacter abortibovis]
MQRALEVGRRGCPSPNPHVGACIVKDGQLVGEAHHDRAGEEHAEIAALRLAGEKAKGATIYVTLEPCNHVGRTPPCTDALLQAGISRAVIGCHDPNPHVTGGGASRLAAEGLQVTVGVEEKKAMVLIAPWAKAVTTGLPYLSLKLALSMDGRIATRTGQAKWVTGPLARQRVHAIRAKQDAIAVGIATVLSDNPQLTVREAPKGNNPIRIVFDTHLRLPLSSFLVKTAHEIPTWVLCGEQASPTLEQELAEQNITMIRVKSSAEGRIHIASALRMLASYGIVNLLVEGGAALAGSMLASQFVDQLHLFISPILLGPRGIPGAIDWGGPRSLEEAPRISEPIWEQCGNDIYVRGSLIFPPGKD